MPFRLLLRFTVLVLSVMDGSGDYAIDENMLIRGEWESQYRQFLVYVENEKDTIQSIVRFHLSLPSEQPCIVARPCEWLRGSFNICIPIFTPGRQPPRLLIRLPLAQRFSDVRAPHLAEEKLRTEAATFAWISRNCTHVPIPRLYGVGLPNGTTASVDGNVNN